MFKFSGTAIVHYISPVMQLASKSGQPFEKRELILNDSWEKDGRQYSNFILVEFTGERMNQLNNFFPGQRVTVEGVLNGREYNNRIFNTVKGTTVTLYQQPAQYAAPVAAPAAGYTPQPQYQQAPQPQYQQAPAGGVPLPQNPPRPTVSQVSPRPQAGAPAYQQPAQYAAPVAAPAAAPGSDDLPF